jgi:hypothetical protein
VPKPGDLPPAVARLKQADVLTQQPMPMSLLRASKILSRPALLHPSLALRTLSTEATPPAPTATKEPSEIAPIPQKDVLSADIISGAPGIALSPL